MKKIKTILICALLAICSLGMFACNAKQFDGFDVPETATAEIGTDYTVKAPAVTLGGASASVDFSIKCNGKDITAVNNIFTINTFHDYVISYTATLEKESLTKTTTVKVTDSVKPVIKIGEYEKLALLGSTVTIAEITSVDNSKEAITPVVAVKFNDTEVKITDGKFKADKIGIYKVIATATDSKLNKASGGYEIECYAKEFGEADNFKYDSSTTYETLNNSCTLSFLKDGYAGSRGGVLKMVSTADDDISFSKLGQELFDGYENFDFLSVRLFIDGENAHNIRLISTKNGGVGKTKDNNPAKEWVTIKFTKAEIKTLLETVSEDAKTFGIWIYNAGASKESFTAYIDEFKFGYNDMTYNVGDDALQIPAITSDITGFSCSVSVTNSNGENVDITNGFAPRFDGIYTVTYTIAGDTIANTSVNKIITVIDTTKPVITLGEYSEVLALGKTFTLPTCAVAPSNSDAVTVVTAYYGDNQSEVITGATYKPTTIGDYTIKFVATDSRNFSDSKQIQFSVHDTTREYSDIQRFNGNSLTPFMKNFESKLTLETATDNVKNGNALKLSDVGGYPIVFFTEIDKTYLDRFDHFTFSIKVTDASKNHAIEVGGVSGGALTPNEWKPVKINKADFAKATTKRWKDVDYTCLSILIANAGADFENFNVYIDEIVGGFADGVAQINEKYTVPVLENASITNFVASVAVKDSKNNNVTLASGEFEATDSNGYTITYTITGDGITQTLMTKKILVTDTRKSYTELNCFERETDIMADMIKNENSELSINTTADNAKTGNSLKMDISVNNGHPIIFLKNIDAAMLSRFDSFSFWIKFSGVNEHRLEIGTYKVAKFAPNTWKQITITKADFTKAITREWDDVNTTCLNILFVNWTGEGNEACVVYLDEFVGKLDDKIIEKGSINTPLTNAGIVNFACAMSVKNSANEDVALSGGNFVPTILGEYTITYNVTGKTILDTVLTRKMTVIDKVPVIETIQDFESITDTTGISVAKPINKVSIDTGLSHDGAKAIKLAVHGDDGMAQIKFSKELIGSKLTGEFVSIDIYVYVFGSKNHRILLTDSAVGQWTSGNDSAKPGEWTKLTFTKANLEKSYGSGFANAELILAFDNAGGMNEWNAGMIIDSITINR